jgi:hypothetical protein
MNKLPDSFALDLERERRLQAATSAPDDDALGADWRLRNQLRALREDLRLPDEVRAGVLNRRSRRMSVSWLGAVAAALLIAVALPLLRTAPDPAPADEIGAAELAEFRLAFNTLQDASIRAGRLVGRGMSQRVALPELGLAELPYAEFLQQSLQPTRRSTSRSRPSESNAASQPNPQEKQP